jgi:hypothetical protein
MQARELLRERPRTFELALRIRHPSMDPAVISRELRLEPDHSFKAGDPRESSSGIAATAVHAESYWLATLDPSEWPTEESVLEVSFSARPQLALARERMRSIVGESLGLALALGATHFLRAHADFIRKVQADGGDVALIVEASAAAMQSFTLTPQVAKVLCELGIAVDFEFTSD